MAQVHAPPSLTALVISCSGKGSMSVSVQLHTHPSPNPTTGNW